MILVVHYAAQVGVVPGAIVDAKASIERIAGVPVPTVNSIVGALRFFFTHSLDRPELARKLVRIEHARKIPVVLSLEEMKRLLEATTCLKHQAALSVAYGAGLRVAEVSALKVSDIVIAAADIVP